MVLSKGQLPASPRGHRILCEPSPVKTETESGLVIPGIAQARPNTGRIIAAGLNALDAMYDHGDQIGDEVWWGKFAGVIEEWDRIVEEGEGHATCEHDWARRPSTGLNHGAWECEKCKSKRLASPLCVLNHDDILCNVSLRRRLESGNIAQARGKTSSGSTQHFMDRKDT
jgi:co-chaperonin GroES (HSP10)